MNMFEHPIKDVEWRLDNDTYHFSIKKTNIEMFLFFFLVFFSMCIAVVIRADHNVRETISERYQDITRAQINLSNSDNTIIGNVNKVNDKVDKLITLLVENGTIK